MLPNHFDLYALVILLVLGIVSPLLGVWDFRRLMRWTEEGRADARRKTYNLILIMEWGITLALVGWWLFAGRDLESLGLVSGYYGWRWLALGVGLAGAVFMIYQMTTVMRSSKELEKLRATMGDLRALAPRTPEEFRAFSLVAVTAGICEEIMYRGVLMAVLVPVIGLWPAVGLTSVIFGLGHVYQGLAGIVKTTLVGLVMALLTVFSGSLLVAIVLHAVIDLTSGRMMGAALQGEMAPIAGRAPLLTARK